MFWTYAILNLVTKKKDMAKNKLVKLIKGLKMKDAGYKRPKLEEPCCATEIGYDMNYPSLYLNAKNVPDLKSYDTGDEITMIVKGVITGHSLDRHGKNERETFDIDIKKILCIDK